MAPSTIWAAELNQCAGFTPSLPTLLYSILCSFLHTLASRSLVLCVRDLLRHAAVSFACVQWCLFTVYPYTASLGIRSELLLPRWDERAGPYSVQWHSERDALLRAGRHLSDQQPGRVASLSFRDAHNHILILHQCYQAADLSLNTGTCTDKTWKDPSCFQQCPRSADYETPYVNTLYRCDWNYWCCSAGGNETSCCNDPNVASFSVTRLDIPAAIYNGSGFASGFTVAPVQALNTQYSVPAPSSTPVNHPTRIGGALLSAPVCRNSTSSPNPITVGIGAGLGVGIPLLIALGSVSFLLLRERRRSRNLLQIFSEGHQSRVQRPYNGISASKEEKAGAVELQGAQMEFEMQGSAQYHELPLRKASQSRR